MDFDALFAEILAEKGQALAKAGEDLARALARLREHDATGGSAAVRDELVWDAAEAAWAYQVQRECCGLTLTAVVDEIYDVPPEVRRRLGVRRRRGSK